MKLFSEKLKNGFTLLEVIVSIAISALLAGGLYIAFSQGGRAVSAIERIIDTDEELLLLYNQLNRDIAAAFVPPLAFAQLKKNTPEARQEKSPKIEKVFDIQATKELFKNFTFITTNSLSTYNRSLPYITRVLYKLEPESEGSLAYKLTRQEIANITSLTGTEKAYTLVTNIKSLKVTIIEAEEKRAAQPALSSSPAQSKKVIEQAVEFVESFSWSSKEKAEKNGRFLPSYIRFEGELWNAKRTKAFDFTFEFKIMAQEALSGKQSLAEQSTSTNDIGASAKKAQQVQSPSIRPIAPMASAQTPQITKDLANKINADRKENHVS